jgi:UDP-N-acetylglucosamine 1-carboxyvinyltransferase
MMERYIIKGGTPLVGDVEISGAKNAALGILAAAVMADETVAIDNLPDVSDVNVLIDAIAEVGAHVVRDSRHSVKINGGTITSTKADNEYIKKIRASYYLLGALLGKFKQAEVPLPGGCNIGSRPIDQHLKGFKALGAEIKIEHGMIIAKADELVGSHIFFDVVSVGATINVMLAAALAKGNTVLENVAKEPHVVDIANMLNSMGANITGIGSNLLKIQGVKSLHGCHHRVLPDMIEVGSFIGMAAMVGNGVQIKDVSINNLGIIPDVFRRLGIEVMEMGDDLFIPHHDSYTVDSFMDGTIMSIADAPWPGLTPDLLSVLLVVATQANGSVLIHQKMFESRLFFVDKLIDMGAQIILCDPHRAVVIGQNHARRLRAGRMTSPDIRAGIALLIAAMSADGTSRIDNIAQIDRGYQYIEHRLNALGAKITRQ